MRPCAVPPLRFGSPARFVRGQKQYERVHRVLPRHRPRPGPHRRRKPESRSRAGSSRSSAPPSRTCLHPVAGSPHCFRVHPGNPSTTTLPSPLASACTSNGSIRTCSMSARTRRTSRPPVIVCRYSCSKNGNQIVPTARSMSRLVDHGTTVARRTARSSSRSTLASSLLPHHPR